MLPARLRVGVRWSDACILNISSRGLMISAGNAFVEGSTVEVRRGAHAILARVMWREGPKAGLWADEPLPVEDIVTMAQSATLEVTAADSLTVERRHRKRTIYDDSRERAFGFRDGRERGPAHCRHRRRGVHAALRRRAHQGDRG